MIEAVRNNRPTVRTDCRPAPLYCPDDYQQDPLHQDEITVLLGEYQSLRAELCARDPRYAAMVAAVPLSTARIQADLLDEDTILLAYGLGERRSFLWLVTQTEIHSAILPARSELESLSRDFYQQVSARGVTTAEEYTRASSGLGRVLLGPVAHRLNSKRLIVIAEGALQYIPFDALIIHNDKRRPK